MAVTTGQIKINADITGTDKIAAFADRALDLGQKLGGTSLAFDKVKGALRDFIAAGVASSPEMAKNIKGLEDGVKGLVGSFSALVFNSGPVKEALVGLSDAAAMLEQAITGTNSRIKELRAQQFDKLVEQHIRSTIMTRTVKLEPVKSSLETNLRSDGSKIIERQVQQRRRRAAVSEDPAKMGFFDQPFTLEALAGSSLGIGGIAADAVADRNRRKAESLDIVTHATERVAVAENKARNAEFAKNRELERSIRIAQRIAAAENANIEVKRFGLAAVQDLAGGILSAADAAIQAGGGFGQAMAQLTKSVLLSVASQALVKSVFHFAEGLAFAATPGLQGFAAGQFAASAKFAAVGVIAGAAGLGLSAATAGGGGGGAGGYAGSRATGSQTPVVNSSTAERTQPEKTEIKVAVYLGDRGNRAAQLMLDRQIAAQVKRAA